MKNIFKVITLAILTFICPLNASEEKSKRGLVLNTNGSSFAGENVSITLPKVTASTTPNEIESQSWKNIDQLIIEKFDIPDYTVPTKQKDFANFTLHFKLPQNIKGTIRNIAIEETETLTLPDLVFFCEKYKPESLKILGLKPPNTATEKYGLYTWRPNACASITSLDFCGNEELSEDSLIEFLKMVPNLVSLSIDNCEKLEKCKPKKWPQLTKLYSIKLSADATKPSMLVQLLEKYQKSLNSVILSGTLSVDGEWKGFNEKKLDKVMLDAEVEPTSQVNDHDDGNRIHICVDNEKSKCLLQPLSKMFPVKIVTLKKLKENQNKPSHFFKNPVLWGGAAIFTTVFLSALLLLKSFNSTTVPRAPAITTLQPAMAVPLGQHNITTLTTSFQQLRT